MSMRRVALPWDSQPQQAVPLNYDNPFTRGLILCIDSAIGPVNLAGRGTLAIVGGAFTRATSVGGQYLGSNATNYFNYTPPATLTDATLFSIERLTGGGQGPWYTNGSNFDFAPYTDNAFYFNTFASSRYVSAAAAPAGIDWNAYSVCCRGGAAASSHAAFINGVKLGSTNSAFTCNSTIRIADNSFSANDQGYLRLMWDRVLTDDEVRIISANPWQVFQERSIWVPPASPTLGPELVSNGTFAANVTGWTKHTTAGTLAWSSASGGCALLTSGNPDPAGASTSITTVIGSTYQVRVRLFSTSSNVAAGLQKGDAVDGSVNTVALLSATDASPTGTKVVEFVATATTTYIAAYVAAFDDGEGGSSAADIAFDDVSVRLVSAAAGGTAAITAAAGTSTAGTLAGSSVATSALTAAAGASTASTLAGSSVAAAAITAAAGVATVSTLVGSSVAASTITAAAGASTAGTLVGSDAASGTASIVAASGASTTSTLAGSSVAVASITAAAGASTAATLTGSGGSSGPLPILGPAYFQNLTTTTVRPGIRITY